MRMAPLIHHPIFETQRDLSHLHRHREPADHEHPEYCARPAHRQRHRDASNIAKADGPRQRRRERRKLADVALRFAFARLCAQHLESMPHCQHIGKAQPDREEQHRQREVQHDQLDLYAQHGYLEEYGGRERVYGAVERFHAS